MTLLSRIVDTWSAVSATRSKLAKVRAIAECLQALNPDEIEIGTLYLAGEIRQGKFGAGYAALKQASVAGSAADAVLTLIEVDQRLSELAALRGAGSAARRKEAFAELFARATSLEQEFLLRLLIGELRQGALAGLMVDAIAAAAQLPAPAVRRAAMYGPQLGAVAAAAFAEGESGLAKFQLQPLSPLAPMLAQTADDVTAALEQLGGEAAFEWKIDGARVQAHKMGSTVRVYTRSSNEVTAAVPEVVEAMHDIAAHTLVLDGEVVALDEQQRARPFQITMRRFGRKLEVEKLRAELPLRVFFFDCLYLNTESLDTASLVDRPAVERFDALTRTLPESMRMPRLITRSAVAAQSFYADALARGHEGVMAKALNAPYEAGNRGASWLKIKRAHTLDLVVLAAEWGHGRRTGKLSNLHLGALDPRTGEYVMLGKTFKGLTDAVLEWQTKEFLARETHCNDWTVYVRPELVVEIAFNDIQASSQYPGGLALRFARVKAYRPDKRVEEADNIDAVRAVFDSQSGALDK